MNELTKELMCISMRNGVELWVENDRILNLKQALRGLSGTKFIDLGEEMINSADITGIYLAKTVEDLVHRRNGERLCKHNVWHSKGQICDCGQNLGNFKEPIVERAQESTISSVREELEKKGIIQ